ncbi:uncharacterized protein V6R79_003694 [Siganus canaliculatus]
MTSVFVRLVVMKRRHRRHRPQTFADWSHASNCPEDNWLTWSHLFPSQRRAVRRVVFATNARPRRKNRTQRGTEVHRCHGLSPEKTHSWTELHGFRVFRHCSQTVNRLQQTSANVKTISTLYGQ